MKKKCTTSCEYSPRVIRLFSLLIPRTLSIETPRGRTSYPTPVHVMKKAAPGRGFLKSGNGYQRTRQPGGELPSRSSAVPIVSAGSSELHMTPECMSGPTWRELSPTDRQLSHSRDVYSPLRSDTRGQRSPHNTTLVWTAGADIR